MEKFEEMFCSVLGGKYVLAVDVGGTNMVGAVLDSAGTIVKEKSVPSRSNASAEVILTQLIGSLIDLSGLTVEQFAGIGLGVPGVTDELGQSVSLAPSLDWHDINIAALLEREFGLPVWAENDVNLFLKGEQLLGTMIGVQNGIGITIGTGIGASLLINGEIYHGTRGAAGEMGYWILDPFVKSQDRRSHGEFETYAAGPGIARRAREVLRNDSVLHKLVAGNQIEVTAKKVFEAARFGDTAAMKVIDDTIAVIGMVLANVSTLLDIEKIVMGGGVVQNEDFRIESVQARINELSPYPPQVVRSSLGSSAVIIGAAVGLVKHIR